jgi:Skp family chaperone for outer membrane proteins
MINELLGKCKYILVESVNQLKGSSKRAALAKTAKELGKGGQSIVAYEFNVSRDTIRKGMRELESGFKIIDAHNAKGRKKIEEKMPKLMDDIKDIVDSQSQTDPNFKTTRLFTRLTVKEIRKQLIFQKGYTDEELPSNQTLNNKVNQLGYTLKKVQKVKPIKKIPETDKIFENIKEVRKNYGGKENTVIISIDAKDRVKIGDFSRGGKSRNEVKAVDHDFSSNYVTPFGILDLNNDNVAITLTQSKVTADFIVDTIEDYWINNYLNMKDTLVIHSDNGPENNSRRTQFVKRIMEFAVKFDITIVLAYYPPYHSKYNPIERVWGSLEKHWNGSILDSLDVVYKFIQNMTWKDNQPSVTITKNSYDTGVTVKKDIMNSYETALYRAKEIGKWFIIIEPTKCNEVLNMAIKV